MPEISQDESSSSQTNASQVARELHWLEKLNIVGQMGLVIIGIVAAVIYGSQLHELKHTNQLTQQALKGSDDSLAKTLDKMQSQVDATNVLASHAKDEVEKASILATNSGKQAKASQKLADAAERNADIATETMQASVNSLHREERAWVGISDAKPITFAGDASAQTANMTVTFTLKNYGHSAAENIRFLAVLESDPNKYALSCEEVKKIHATMVLLPTQEQSINWVMNLNADQIAKGWSHQNPVFGRQVFPTIIGCIDYIDRDAEVPPHRTPFGYRVFWTKDYISLDKVVPANELLLFPLTEDAGSSQVR